MVPLRNPIDHRLASLRPSERGDPNLVEGLASDRSSGGGTIALKRGVVLLRRPMALTVEDCGGAKALMEPAEASRQEMRRGRFMLVSDISLRVMESMSSIDIHS